MSSWADHITEMVTGDYIALIEDPTGERKSGVSTVQGFMAERVYDFKREEHLESQKGAANIGKITILQALQYDYASFAEALDSILYLDHEHPDEDKTEMPDLEAEEGDTEYTDPAVQAMIDAAYEQGRLDQQNSLDTGSNK